MYVAQLGTTFHWNKYATGFYGNYDGHMELAIPDDITGEARATDLREIRGRILRFTHENPDYIDLVRANRMLATAGLAPWTPATEAVKNRFYVSFSGYITTDLTREQLNAKLLKYLTRQGAETQRLEFYIDASRDRDTSPVRVPMSETTALLPLPGRSF
jgi:hypothetical protein